MSKEPASKGSWLVGAIVAAAIAALVYLLLGNSWAKHPPKSEASSAASIADPSSFPDPNAATVASETPRAAATASGLPELDRARADAIREKLRTLPPPTPTATGKIPPPNFPEMPAASDTNAELAHYIKDKVHEDYMPLAKSCYENALVRTPDLRGKLVMKFRIVGDRRVGGVVDSADVDPETTIHGDDFLQCVKESMMAVSFDAPPHDGHVDVTYPILFSPDDGG